MNNAPIIGGLGRTVEIDEVKFGKRKYKRECSGGIERKSKYIFVDAVEY